MIESNPFVMILPMVPIFSMFKTLVPYLPKLASLERTLAAAIIVGAIPSPINKTIFLTERFAGARTVHVASTDWSPTTTVGGNQFTVGIIRNLLP